MEYNLILSTIRGSNLLERSKWESEENKCKKNAQIMCSQRKETKEQIEQSAISIIESNLKYSKKSSRQALIL